MTVKYACLVFDLPIPFPYFAGRYSFEPATELFDGTVKDLIEGSDSSHWKEWIGSITWDALNQNSRLILTAWQKSDRPEILDHENEALKDKLLTIFRILPLIGPVSPPNGDTFIFSGQAILANGQLKFQDIRSFSKVDSWTKSYFSENYWDEFFIWAKTAITLPKFLNEWRNGYLVLGQLLKNKTNRQIVEAFTSFEEAVKTRRLESKIPSLFRSIECIVECWGKKDFASRVSYLIGHPSNDHPYGVWQDTNDLLLEVYELRNDCCHGKPFAYSVYTKLKGPAPGALIAKYEYIAEWAARKVILDGFNNATILAHTHKYEDLVDAWQKGLIKP